MRYIRKFRDVMKRLQEHRLNAASAHAAFFIILSFIPCIILLFSLLQFTSFEKQDVLQLIQTMVLPEIQGPITGIVEEAYSKTASVISLSALVTAWSAGRGMMALTQGLQWIAGIQESRNYFTVRIRAALYTVVLLLSVIVFLLLGVFGNTLLSVIGEKIPMAAYAANMIVDVKNIFLLLFATVIFALIYRFMPGNKMPLKKHVPGAALSAAGWFGFSYVFSIYVEKFHGFSDMYGSLTTLIFFMLWLYFCMYITLFGAELNQLLQEHFSK